MSKSRPSNSSYSSSNSHFLLLPAPQAYELIQGQLVKGSTEQSKSLRPPSTAVLVHGILGNKRNLLSFANRLVQAYPAYQVRSNHYFRLYLQ